MHIEPLTQTTDPWRWWRDQMPIVGRFAYFDHAAVAPVSGPAAAAIEDFADQATSRGDTVWPSWNARLGQLRKQCGELLAADEAEICVVPNTTAGINLVAEGYPWQPGDSVVIPDGEFPSNLFPWMNQAAKGVELRIVPRRDQVVSIDDLMDRCDETTKIIAVSWVGYASGHRIDVDELVQRAHERGILVFLDAIQGLGIYDLNLAKTPVDFLAADGHKWLLGPEGMGIAMIRKDHVGMLRATNVGWASVKNSHNYNQPSFDLRDDATRFESGSANMMGAAALVKSIEIFLSVLRLHGRDAIERRVITLANLLNDQLIDAGATTLFPARAKHQSGIVNFQLTHNDPAMLRQLAIKRDVIVSCRGSGIRASIHAYNDESDIDRLIEVIRENGP